MIERVGKSFDIDGKFEEIKRLFDGHESWEIGECERVSLDIVSGLTDILKEINQKSPNKSNNRLVDSVCKFIDEISKKECGIWGLSKYEKNGEILFSFLNELAADKKFVPQIDRIFRSGSGVYPFVNQLSKFPETKKKFNELFQKLPEWYQNKLLGETISYEEGDKTYTCSLIGGTALMGFQKRRKFYIIVFLIKALHKGLFQAVSQNKVDNMKILDIKNNKIDKKKNKDLISDIKKIININY